MPEIIGLERVYFQTVAMIYHMLKRSSSNDGITRLCLSDSRSSIC